MPRRSSSTATEYNSIQHAAVLVGTLVRGTAVELRFAGAATPFYADVRSVDARTLTVVEWGSSELLKIELQRIAGCSIPSLRFEERKAICERQRHSAKERAAQRKALAECSGRGRKVYYAGRVQNVAGWAKELGISAATLSARLQRGMTPDAAFTLPVRAVTKRIAVHGELMRPREAAHALGIGKTTLYMRRKKGQDIGKPPQRRPKFYTYQGESLTLAAWSKRCGVPPMTLRGRVMQLGLSIEQALTLPRDRGAVRKFLRAGANSQPAAS